MESNCFEYASLRREYAALQTGKDGGGLPDLLERTALHAGAKHSGSLLVRAAPATGQGQS